MCIRDSYQCAALGERLERHLSPDRYGLGTICNLYFDTENYSIIRSSLEKPAYKEKLRLRSYGVPTSESNVFLELKKKCEGVVYKRRTPLFYREAVEYLQSGRSPNPDDPTLREIGWFLNRYHPIPRTCLCYDRAAYYGVEDPNLRVTFDFRVRYRDCDLELAAGDYGREILPSGSALMEIKVPRAIPLYLSRILSELGIFPTSFSKYGVCYQKQLEETGGILHV